MCVQFAVAFARIEAHYFVHGGWFKYDGQLIAEANLLKDIPGADHRLCPFSSLTCVCFQQERSCRVATTLCALRSLPGSCTRFASLLSARYLAVLKILRVFILQGLLSCAVLQAWPKSELKMCVRELLSVSSVLTALFGRIPDAGHSAKEPGIVSELVKACDKYQDL